MNILVWSYTKEDRTNTVWVYLPFLRRIVRGDGMKRSRGAPGNDFEPEDYGLRKLDKDTHRFLKEEVIENRKYCQTKPQIHPVRFYYSPQRAQSMRRKINVKPLRSLPAR